ncbi:MAG: UDP-N-acetylmuramate dehydrogenase [Holophagales bacterium]|nr:UDP-N-acetylmuramate dehydrogenase [Holophagales bacterium]
MPNLTGLPDPLFSIPHKRDVPFSQLTTLGLGGICRWLFEPSAEEEAALFVRTCNKNDVPFRVLGGGSNLLVLSDIATPVLRLALPKTLFTTSGGAFASASCGHAALAHNVADLGLSGIEWAGGIPGSFGGAIRMNAGAHGGEWGQALEKVRFVSPVGEIVEKEVGPGDFSYRSSFLANGGVALGAWFALDKGEAAQIKAKMDSFLEARRKTQPSGRSAGSIFKNPPGQSAGKLIESVGLKGTRIGNAQVSPKHANFIVNLGDAAPSDYWELIQLAKSKALEAHGIDLELEIEVWKK